MGIETAVIIGAVASAAAAGATVYEGKQARKDAKRQRESARKAFEKQKANEIMNAWEQRERLIEGIDSFYDRQGWEKPKRAPRRKPSREEVEQYVEGLGGGVATAPLPSAGYAQAAGQFGTAVSSLASGQSSKPSSPTVVSATRVPTTSTRSTKVRAAEAEELDNPVIQGGSKDTAAETFRTAAKGELSEAGEAERQRVTEASSSPTQENMIRNQQAAEVDTRDLDKKLDNVVTQLQDPEERSKLVESAKAALSKTKAGEDPLKALMPQVATGLTELEGMEKRKEEHQDPVQAFLQKFGGSA